MTTTGAVQADAATVLANSAFGSTPGRWPLPPATSPQMLWWRAVAAGGQGRYGSALADLADLCRIQRSGPLVSLAYSTRGSFVRQLGWHARARVWDGRAVATAGADPAARTDALIGLAADALGVGRFAAAARLLGRSEEMLVGVGRSDRQAVRLAWVSAELAMVRGAGTVAIGHAEQAVDAAAGLGSARHALKSEVVLAAALCTAGEIQRSRRVADAALQSAGRLGLIPLRWALACLLADIGSGTLARPQIVDIRDQSAEAIRARGGVWSGR